MVTGATGNVWTSLIGTLADDPQASSVLGLARRLPAWTAPKTEWARADVATDDLLPQFRGADVVVHLAWLFQPTHPPSPPGKPTRSAASVSSERSPPGRAGPRLCLLGGRLLTGTQGPGR